MIGAVRAAKYGGAALAGLVALVGLLYVTGVIGVPEAGLQDNEWGEVEEDRIEVVTTVWIDNPNPFGASVDRIDYDLAMNGVHLATGGSEQVSVPPGNDTVTFRTDLNHTRIPAWWASHVRQGERSDVRVDADVHVSAAGRTASRPVSHEDQIETDVERMLGEALSELEGEYRGTEGDVRVAGQRIEPRVEVRDTAAEWGEVTTDRTDLIVTLDVHNPNVYPIPTPGFTGAFEMNDVEVLQWDVNEIDVVTGPDDGVVPPQTTERVQFRVELDNHRFAEWFATHVDAEERTDARLSAQLAFHVGGSQVTIPPEGDAVRCDFDLRTAIFVDQVSGLERRGCELTALSATRSELEEASGGVLTLSNTDWWDSREARGDESADDGRPDDGQSEAGRSDDGEPSDGGDQLTEEETLASVLLD